MSKVYKLDYQVYLDDIDFWGVVSHHRWIAILERVRTAAFAEAFKDLLGKGFGLLVAGLDIKYKKPARFNDKLTLEVSFEAFGRTSMQVKHVAKNLKGEPLVEANVHLVHVNREGKPAAIPDWAREKFIVEE